MISVQASGCSWFFITSSILSLVNGKQNIKNSIENARKDEVFQRELQRQKELYEDQKEAEDRAFKLWLKQRQREFARSEASKKLENDLMKEDLKMFIKDWPLHISAEAIIEKRKAMSSVETTPLNIVVGKHYIGESKQLDVIYSQMVDMLSVELKESGLINNVYRFKDDNTVIGGPALANIFALMSNMPAVVLIPRFDKEKDKLSISIGYWNQDSLFPMQKKVLELDYNEMRMVNDKDYSSKKKAEINCSYATIAMVLNDTHLLLENYFKPLFPSFAEKKNISLKTHPSLIDFAQKEYSSLSSMEVTTAKYNIGNLISEDEKNWSRVSDLAREAINQLKM